MAVVDHERAWLRLKEYVLSRPSHGQRDLNTEMARLEVECELPEGEQHFSGLPPVSRPSDERPARASVMASH